MDLLKVMNELRYTVLFGTERYDAIYHRIRYLTSEKSDIICSVSHNFARIGIDSYNSLPIEKNIDFS